MSEKIRYRRDDDGKMRRVVMYRGHEGYTVRWTQHCSGCTEYWDYCEPPEAGAGCEECGYTGKSRQSFWVPFDEHPDAQDENQEHQELESIKARASEAGLDVVPEEWLRPWRAKWENHWENVRTA